MENKGDLSDFEQDGMVVGGRHGFLSSVQTVDLYSPQKIKYLMGFSFLR